MRIFALWIALAAGTAHAQDVPAEQLPLVQLTMRPWAELDGVARPFRYIVALHLVGNEDAEVVGDRRLVSLEVRPPEGRRGRVHRCRHPAPPRRVENARVRTLSRSETDSYWREWIDVRMYCSGRALDALRQGAWLAARYGWTRGSRTRWIARRANQSQREWEVSAAAPPFLFEAIPPAETRSLAAQGGSTPIRLLLAPSSASTGGTLVFRISIRTREGRRRILVRPDAFGFAIEGPSGPAQCETEMVRSAPPPDFFRSISARTGATQTLDADFFCAAGTFAAPGVYEITPRVELVHSGEEYGFNAITGRFAGPPVAIRITRGRGGYREQLVQRFHERTRAHP